MSYCFGVKLSDRVRSLSNFTGDVAFRILESLHNVGHRAVRDIHDDNHSEETQIFVCDINPNMLQVGKKRAQERGKAICVCACVYSFFFL